MKVLLVTIDIKPEHKERFMEEMLLDAKGSNENEPSCLRFDILQDDENPNRIHLYEVYRDEAALEAHTKAPHFLRWIETVKDWFDGDRTRRMCTNVYPTDAAWR
ncbi:MAG: putative quinol monooxygenase [Dehalococcoidia bacterium]